MELGFTFMILAVLIIAIWVIFELRRLKHKVFAIFLIALVLFFYASTSIAFREQTINFKSQEGITSASKIYFAWLGSAFSNAKIITTNAIKMDWSTQNSSIGE